MSIKNSLRIAGVYTTVILGAGFVSGQELLNYFVRHGISGLIGLAVTGALFAVTGWAVLDICRRKGLGDYHAFIQHIAGSKLGTFIEAAAAFFMLVMLSAMLAAGGAFAGEVLNAPFSVGAGAIAILCLAALLPGGGLVIEINAFLAPVMIVGGIFFGLYAFANQSVDVFAYTGVIPAWAVSAVVYASYNIITSVSVLSSLGGYVKDRRTAAAGGLLGGTAIVLLAVCMALPLYAHYNRVSVFEIPIYKIASAHGAAFKRAYIAFFASAVFTGAAVNAHAICKLLHARFGVKKQAFSKILVVTAGFLLAHAGFSNIVTRIYPIFGYLGFFQILLILFTFISRKR